MAELQGTVVVTGGGRGIGAAVARRLAGEGWDVVVGYRRDVAAAEAVVREVEALGSRAVALQVELAEPASIDRFFDEAEAWSPIAGLVANAGEATAVGRLEDLDPAAIRHDLDVLVLGTLLCARRAVPAIRRAGGGAMVLISSAAATIGGAGEYVHYAAAKAAVDAMTLGLAREVAADRIRVNAVAPGLIRTEFHRDPTRPDRLGASVPMGRPGEAEEVAGAVAWLLSEDAAYTTGAVLRVAGGR